MSGGLLIDEWFSEGILINDGLSEGVLFDEWFSEGLLLSNK